MKTPGRRRVVLALLSVTALLAVYTLVSNASRFLDLSLLPPSLARLLRPEILPPTQGIVEALVGLVSGHPQAAGEGHVHVMDHLGYLADQRVTLQGALAVSAARVLFGVLIGGLLGILSGFLMGWSPALDDYIHPIYILVRSIPPLAVITYVMLWVGHGEAHLLIPIVYAVFTTVVIPTYHGVRDLAPVHVVAARSLGARGPLLWFRVVLPALAPAVLSALRYSIIIAWMTAVGAEMLMADNGMGHLLAGGGLWAGRTAIRVDPAVIIAGILGLATVGYAMDAAAGLVTRRATFWTARRRQW
jgi:sulfonate transport system permease protein